MVVRVVCVGCRGVVTYLSCLMLLAASPAVVLPWLLISTLYIMFK